jgi:hypothetical protein
VRVSRSGRMSWLGSGELGWRSFVLNLYVGSDGCLCVSRVSVWFSQGGARTGAHAVWALTREDGE